MKLILSRKGFDASSGGAPSPILEDGTMLPLPIPDPRSPIRYRDVILHGRRLGPLVARATAGRIGADHGAHLDPDLLRGAFPRRRGWRPVFGQSGSAQGVLARAGIGPGDLFLFFGWFRPDRHVIWGWMEIGAVVPADRAPAWARDHPHVAAPAGRVNNTLYLARRAGVFRTFDPALQLTTPGAPRSRWSLPAWFAPRPGRPALGYHADPARWRPAGDRVELQSVGRGQEFVLDLDGIPEASAWLRAITGAARGASSRGGRRRPSRRR